MGWDRLWVLVISQKLIYQYLGGKIDQTCLQDPYGHYKLACEEALAHYRTKEGPFSHFGLRSSWKNSFSQEEPPGSL